MLVVELNQREPGVKPWVLSLAVVGSVASTWVERALKFLLMANPPGPVGSGVTTSRPLYPVSVDMVVILLNDRC
jgi:hypothetical protein